MIVTLTPDPVLDRAFFIPTWTPGIPMHAERSTVSVGGKGLDASVALSHLGVASQAFCFLSGATGQQLLGLAQAYGIQVRPTWAAGETRTAVIVVEEHHQRHSHLFSGQLQIRPDDNSTLISALESALADAPWLIIGGILPPSLSPDFYAQITMLAHHKGTPVLIDSFGHYLHPALPIRPEIVKMNWKEFELTFGLEIPDQAAMIDMARRVRQSHHLPALVITCGPDGILGLTDSGGWIAHPPLQPVVNAAGAGDAASGTLAWRLACGENWPEALRWAAAAGAAVVLTETTADLQRSDFERILPLVSIEQLV